MKHLSVFVAALSLLGGCSKLEDGMSPAAKECWGLTKALLRSPSTAKLESFAGEGAPNAFVTYDAANAFGTPVRSTAMCTFEKNSETWVVKSINIDGSEVDPVALATAQYRQVSEDLRKLR